MTTSHVFENGMSVNKAGGGDSSSLSGIHVLAKPIGALCNLDCEYCFYREKEAFFPKDERYRMSDEVLAIYIAEYVAAQPTPAVEFVWHGGEPTLVGLNFFRKVVSLQQPYKAQKTIRNSLQTNGMRLDDEWCAFLKEHDFLVGLSLDGPKEIHDRYRKDKQGRGTFDRVLAAAKLLQQHQVEFNVLACVSKETAYQPLEVYRFFREQGFNYIQFTPVIERLPDAATKAEGLCLAKPAALDHQEPNREVTSWTVEPEAYGDFLIAIFEEWVRHDVGTVFVVNFDWALNAWCGFGSPVCIFARRCGKALALEHNGDLYACDHYVYPEYLLGNLREQPLGDLLEKSLSSGFGAHKELTLPRQCRECGVKEACWGGCPKHRFTLTQDGEPGLHYLCIGYKKFFCHIRKYLKAMSTLLEHNLPVSMVMQAIEQPLMVALCTEKSGEKYKN